MSQSPRHREQSGRPSRGHNSSDDSENYENVPDEFFCPISRQFMSDPVKIPGSNLTYNRNSVKDLYEPEDVQLDLRMRMIMEKWLSKYELEPPFHYLSDETTISRAFTSVLKQRDVDLLGEFKLWLKNKAPKPLSNGGVIWYVDKLLKSPHPSASWVATTLSIVAHVDNDDELRVPEHIHPEYLMLSPIPIALDSESENEEFQLGLVNLMHALVMNSPDISAMEEKLGGILEALVSYIWPVRQHFIPNRYYRKLLDILEILPLSEENCRRMVDAGITDMLSKLLKFGVCREIMDDPDYLAASMALDKEIAHISSVIILYRIFEFVTSLSTGGGNG